MSEICILDPVRFEEAAEVIRRSFLTVAKDFGLTVENCPTNGAFLKTERLLREKEQGTDYYGLFQNGTLAGTVGIRSENGDTYEMVKLAVLPEFRHQSHGKTLMDFVCEEIKKRGGTKVTIGVIYENLQLIKWYCFYGFTETETKTFPHLPFTVSYMEKCL